MNDEQPIGSRYFKEQLARYTDRINGQDPDSYFEEKVQAFWQSMREGLISTAHVYHEKDRNKLATRFALNDPEDFILVTVPANVFKRFYPKYEGTRPVLAYQLNPERFGEPPKLVLQSEASPTLFDDEADR